MTLPTPTAAMIAVAVPHEAGSVQQGHGHDDHALMAEGSTILKSAGSIECYFASGVTSSHSAFHSIPSVSSI
jgi:hypothetical protein